MNFRKRTQNRAYRSLLVQLTKKKHVLNFKQTICWTMMVHALVAAKLYSQFLFDLQSVNKFFMHKILNQKLGSFSSLLFWYFNKNNNRITKKKNKFTCAAKVRMKEEKRKRNFAMKQHLACSRA